MLTAHAWDKAKALNQSSLSFADGHTTHNTAALVLILTPLCTTILCTVLSCAQDTSARLKLIACAGDAADSVGAAALWLCPGFAKGQLLIACRQGNCAGEVPPRIWHVITPETARAQDGTYAVTPERSPLALASMQFVHKTQPNPLIAVCIGHSHVGYMLVALSLDSLPSVQFLCTYIVTHVIVTAALFATFLLHLGRHDIVHLRRGGAAQDLASHHAWDGHQADDGHLVQAGLQGCQHAALDQGPGRLHARGSQPEHQLQPVLACSTAM